MQLQQADTVSPIPFGRFESEFRRVYSDLYPNEDALRKAIAFYGQQHPYLEITPVDTDSRPRIEYLKRNLNARTSEDIHKLIDMRIPDSYYTFNDMKEIVGEETVDLVYLSPGASRVAANAFFPETLEVNVGKCITAMRKNNIKIGNFANVIWQRGNTYLNAVEDGLLEWESQPFAVTKDEPTYERSILAVSNVMDEGVMLGEYISFLRWKKGIGIPSKRGRPEIPGFCFISKNYKASGDIGFCLDTLKWF